MRDMDIICELVGKVTEEDLRYVDVAVSKHLGIFVPSVGFCQYAISPHHTHPAYMFNVFLTEEHCIVDQKIEVPENAYLATVLAPHIPHEEKVEGEFKRYYAILIDQGYFDKAYYAYEKKLPPKYIWKQFYVGREILFYMKQFMNEYENPNCNNQNVLEPLAMLMTQILVRSLLRLGEKITTASKDYDIQRVEQYIQQNFGSKLTIAKLAEVGNLSISRFVHRFKKETGCSAIEYVLNIRLEKAKKFLKSDTETITEIAFLCGFNSASHFSSSFLKQMGETPSAYRKRYEMQDFETK